MDPIVIPAGEIERKKNSVAPSRWSLTIPRYGTHRTLALSHSWRHVGGLEQGYSNVEKRDFPYEDGMGKHAVTSETIFGYVNMRL